MGRTTFNERENIRKLNQQVRRCNRNHRGPGIAFKKISPELLYDAYYDNNYINYFSSYYFNNKKYVTIGTALL